jgi:ketosteroid isomerase-like protein
MNTPIETVRGFYDALGRGDVSGVLALPHNELEWTEAERFPYYSGTWRSPQEILDKVFVALARDWDGFSAKAHDFIAAGDRVVSLAGAKRTFSSRAYRTGFMSTRPKLSRFLHRVGRCRAHSSERSPGWGPRSSAPPLRSCSATVGSASRSVIMVGAGRGRLDRDWWPLNRVGPGTLNQCPVSISHSPRDEVASVVSPWPGLFIPVQPLAGKC